MAIVNRNIAGLDRKEWQMMTPAPVATAAGSFVIADDAEGQFNLALYVVSATVMYLYHHDEDSFVQIAAPSPAFGGTFGAGACGARTRWSTTLTANGGTTTTATTTATINGLCIGRKIRFLTGSQIGVEATITGVIIVPGGTSTIQFAAIGGAIVNTDTFVIDTGRFFILNAGTLATNSFRSYDPLIATWSATLAFAGLPATIATDGRMVSTPDLEIYASGTASAGAATTLTNGAKTWTVNQWTNYQLRITGGTGIGQVRSIASNTGTVITVSAAWTTTPDATSTYAIEANADYLYFLGNNAVTLYRYSISANTWSTLSPGVARSGAPSTGMTAHHIDVTGDTNWANESAILDGKYIYSFRGGAGALLDRYDIPANSWLAITYGNQAETFTTGTSACNFGRYIILRKDATNRFFKYSVRGNYLEPLSVNLYTDGTAALGNKMWIYKHPEDPTGTVFLNSLANTGTPLHRLLLF
jgi:hypothetical protein